MSKSNEVSFFIVSTNVTLLKINIFPLNSCFTFYENIFFFETFSSEKTKVKVEASDVAFKVVGLIYNICVWFCVQYWQMFIYVSILLNWILTLCPCWCLYLSLQKYRCHGFHAFFLFYFLIYSISYWIKLPIIWGERFLKTVKLYLPDKHLVNSCWI